MASIVFPPPETVSMPWTDDYGQQWTYTYTNSEGIIKNRWTPLPSASSGGGSVISNYKLAIQEQAPVDPTITHWFRTVDGVTYTRYDDFWVSDNSAPIPALDDVWAVLDTKLSAITTPIEITADDDTLLATEHANNYVYFSTGTNQRFLIPDNDDFPIGTAVTVDNIGANIVSIDVANDLTTTLLFPEEAGWNELDQYEMAQILKLAPHVWRLM